ncbi:MAG: hypothetical protein KDG52_18355 [Rhodocyclaceae bacterium]|nr:hypothetical protein [Rhodocyclaceae bacterium]
MQTQANAHPGDISRVLHKNTPGSRSAITAEADRPRVLLARFASDLSCQLGLLLCQRGHHVVAQSSLAQYSALGLGGCEDECFPCTEVHFPYLGRDHVESVLKERGPFDVVVIDLMKPRPGGPAPEVGDGAGREQPEAAIPDAAMLADVATCARHLAQRGGAIWLLSAANDGAGASASIDAGEAFLHSLANNPEFARVSLNSTHIAPRQGRIEAIHFERDESWLLARPQPRSPRGTMEFTAALLDLLAIPACRGRPAAAPAAALA